MTTLLNSKIVEKLHDSPGFEIFRACRLADGRPVILKVIRELQPSPERIARLKHEHDILSRVDSPLVIRTYGIETDHKRWGMVLEDFGGEPLSALLASGALDLAARLELAIAVTRAVDALHSHNVIHKDINPANILVHPQSKAVKLIDFSIATVLTREKPSFFNRSVLEGTLAYISPEQTGRMSAPVDYRTDFYSLGVTLYELFTGQRPFATEDANELVYAHIARRPPRPDELRPELPGVLADIVMKLLAKTAEERYQSGYGIVHDLQRCAAGRAAGGAVAAFDLGQQDVSERFLIPQRLYGREADVASLIGALKRTVSDAGAAELLLVTGRSGMGKSVLVQDLYRPITEAHGSFIAGKFDQFLRSQPYSAVVAAFRSLVGELLGRSEEQLAAWRAKLLAALGPNGRVITDVIPQVELIVGPQPEIAELPPNENRNRFNLVFRRFIRTFAEPAHPVVMFLDDLQWADSASLSLMEQLVTDRGAASGLLLIGAYRDNEVDAAHPLTLSLGRLAEQGVHVEKISLQPLSTDHIAELIADTLGVSRPAAGPLAAVVERNTGGNPLFVTELLKTLYDDGLVTFDRELGRWRWDASEVEAKGYTSSVLELMIDKLARLPEETQAELRIAACIGNRFELGTLAAMGDRSLGDVFSALMPALQAGVVVTGSALDALTADEGAPEAECYFFHDRVQQAAYSTLSEAERERLHLIIGRRLLERVSAEEPGDAVFEIADQLNHGKSLITDAGEGLKLVDLNRIAGERALASNAYDAAVRYLREARAMLPEAAWAEQHERTMAVVRSLAMAEFLVGNHERSDQLTDDALNHAATALERAEILTVVLRQRTTAGRYPDAIEALRRGLAVLDYALPSEGIDAAIESAYREVQEALAGRAPRSLRDGQTMTDPRVIAINNVVQSGLAPCFYVNQSLYNLLILRMMRLALEYGHPPTGLALYSWYGNQLASVYEQKGLGYEFGVLGIELAERAGQLRDKCLACFSVAQFAVAWVKHLREVAVVNQQGYQAGLESGELTFGGYMLFYFGLTDFMLGRPLDELYPEVIEQLAFNERLNSTAAVEASEGLLAVLANLRSTAGPHDELSLNSESEATFVQRWEEHQHSMGLAYYYIFKTQLMVLYRDFERAVEAARSAQRLLPAIVGHVALAWHAFFSGLAYIAASESRAEEQARELLDAARAELDRIAVWAERCPENFGYMHALLSAELLRVSGDPAAAEPYERAIELAEQHGFTQNAALARELAGRFWLGRRRATLAGSYLKEAQYGYTLWGAKRKLALLQQELQQLGEGLAGTAPAVTNLPAVTDLEIAARGGTGSTMTSASVLDLASVIKASQAISGEIVLERLLGRLLELVIENAGATRGVLVVIDEGELLVEAHGTLRTHRGKQRLELSVMQSVPFADFEHIAHGVVHYVARTGETLILNDALHLGPFTRDPYVTRAHPLAVLCLPLTKKGQHLAYLYLENGTLAGAFTADRIEVLKLLASQFAISWENAQLYTEMEDKVQKRTEELRLKNEELARTLDQLRATQDRLIHSEKMASLGQLTAGVAHEINNPLNFVNNFAMLGLRLCAKIEERRSGDPAADIGSHINKLKQNIDTIAKYGKRASDIVHSMLEHARGTAGPRQLTDINAFVEQHAKLAELGLRNQRSQVDIQLQLSLGKDVGQAPIVTQEIGRVLVNLLTNAHDALAVRGRAGGGEPGFSGLVRIETERVGENVEIRVVDNGCGIPADIRSKIFEPFFTTKSGTQGTGLGLSLCYDIVVQGHNGSLDVESTLGEGTRFTIRLPVLRD